MGRGEGMAVVRILGGDGGRIGFGLDLDLGLGLRMMWNLEGGTCFSVLSHFLCRGLDVLATLVCIWFELNV